MGLDIERKPQWRGSVACDVRGCETEPLVDDEWFDTPEQARASIIAKAAAAGWKKYEFNRVVVRKVVVTVSGVLGETAVKELTARDQDRIAAICPNH